MPKSVEKKIKAVINFRDRLHEYHDIPRKDLDFEAFKERCEELEKTQKGYLIAQQAWNLDWILSELRNIECSIEEIGKCLEEYSKL